MLKGSNEKYSNSLEIQKRLNYAQNYNDWLFSQVEKYIGNRVLEIGCALGNFTKKIINRNFVCVIDIEEGYIKSVRDLFKDVPNLKAVKYDVSSSEILALKNDRFDTILCFNVLEHLEKDELALQNMYKLIDGSGCLCLIVPAFQSIFGEMDITDNHFRRYNKSSLQKKIKKAGFRILRMKYINVLGFFGWWFNSKVLRRKFIPFRQMIIYDKLIPFINHFEKIFNPPFGQSLVLIANK